MAAKSFTEGRVGIVGLGLIGGSFAKALASAGQEVLAYNRSRAILDLAKIETVTDELTEETISTCELIILCAYPAFSIEYLHKMANRIADGAIVIDAVGIKRAICEDLFALAESHGWTFIGAHPMAGTQYSGYAHAKANLFKGAPLVVVPPQMDDILRANILERLKVLLAPCQFGSFTLATADLHDRQIAYTSQLAHIVSNAYVKSPAAQLHHGFSAGSYKDLTRVAQLNADMWTELFIDNADYLSAELGGLISHLSAYKEALDAHDAPKLHELLAEGDKLKRQAEARS